MLKRVLLLVACLPAAAGCPGNATPPPQPTAADAPNLIAGLRDCNARRDWAGAMNTIHKLGQLGPDARDAVPEILVTLKAVDRGELRAWIIADLGAIGPDAKEAVPVLVADLEHQDEVVRKAAAKALSRIDPSAVKKSGEQ
jgi:HEAT repeat protein